MAFDNPSIGHDPSSGVLAPSTWGDAINNSFDALNTDAVYIFPDMGSGEVPFSGVAGAGYELIESSDSGAPKMLLRLLRFDDTIVEGRQWGFRLPRQYGGNPVLVGKYKMQSANVDKDVVLVAKIGAVSSGDSAVSAKAYGADNSATERVPASADEEADFSITLTNADSLAANDLISVHFERDKDAGGDNAADDFMLTDLALNYTLQA